jgi:hypothetical protein
MNFDYLEASKSLSKDKLCLDYLNYEASYSSGWNKFIYEGCRIVEIWFNPEADKMKIKGSIPYFIAGQNFKTGPEDFINGVTHLSEVLKVDLRKAEVNVFEYGTILEIPFLVREVLSSHLKIQGMKTRPFDYGKYFEDRVLRVKLYDAGKNIKDKLNKEERNRLISACDYCPHKNYLRIENHYKKPSICFKGRVIIVGDLLKPEFQTICREDLLTKYRSIIKANSILVKNKKQLTSSTIPLLLLKEFEDLLPGNVEDLLRQKIKSFPIDLLTKEDKKSRRRQIKNNWKKVQTVRTCQYDISGILKDQIFSSES